MSRIVAEPRAARKGNGRGSCCLAHEGSCFSGRLTLRRPGRCFTRRRLLPLLHLLLLLDVFLLQLLRLLLVPLLDLLLLSVVRFLLRQLLVVLILLLLKLLPFLVLFRDQLSMLLLNLLIARRISSVRGKGLPGRQIPRMHDICGASRSGFRARRLFMICRRSRFLSWFASINGFGPAAPGFRTRGGGFGRAAVIH